MVVRLILVSSVYIVGCDPAVDIRGVVLADNDTPVANATVAIVCESDARIRIDGTTTDEDGAFTLHGIGYLPRACVVRATLSEMVGMATVNDGCKETVLACQRRRFCAKAEVVIHISKPHRF
jgi:hypothetical protein